MSIPDTFLLEEVRCGFPVPSAIKQAWAAELEVLMEIDRVCRKHGIQYFADWGTLLGAVRHGGFVPWDDDLDIVMKRADYEKFMTVARFDMEEGFDVQTYRNQKDFWLFMGKVVGKNRFCFEKEHLRRFHNFPYIACVDIFVLDYVYRDREKEEKRRRLCKYMLGVADAIVEGNLSLAERAGSLDILREMSGQQLADIEEPVEMGRYLYGEIEKLFAAVPKQEADYLCQLFPWGLKGDAFHIPKEDYEQAIYLPFECITIPVPRLYDKMLRLRYGDYLKVVEDAGAHNYPFFEGQRVNLQKVLDFELPEFKPSAQPAERSKGSYKAMALECVEELWRMEEQLGVLCKGTPTATAENMAQLEELLKNSQQLAVDLGTLLEQLLGENTEIVPLLEQYCENLYFIYEKLQTLQTEEVLLLLQQGRMLRERISVALKRIIARRTVLFLPVLAKDWEGLQSLWEEAVRNPSCDVLVAALPYYFKDYDGTAKELLWDGEGFPDEVQVLDYRALTAEYLELLHPETIILQNPYDGWNPAYSVPRQFYAERLRSITDELVCAQPFEMTEGRREAESPRSYSNMKYYVTMPGVVYADKILVKSKRQKALYVKRLTEFAGKETAEDWEQRVAVYEPASPKQDAAKEKAAGVKTPKMRLLYGISEGSRLEAQEAAQRKYEKNIRLFGQLRERIEVTVRHFPGEDMGNVAEYDAYYGDSMPVVMEFLQAKKPVMIQNYDL